MELTKEELNIILNWAEVADGERYMSKEERILYDKTTLYLVTLQRDTN